MQSQDVYDVTIIGAGIVGICCALSARERGLTVRLIDRDEPGRGASFGNAGVISPLSFVPQSLPGVWKSVPRWVFKRDGPVALDPRYLPTLMPWAVRFFSRCNEADVRKTSDAMEILVNPCIDIYRAHLQGTGHEDLLVDSHYVHVFRDADPARLSAIDYRIRKEKGAGGADGAGGAGGADIELIGADALRKLEPALSQTFQAAVVMKGQARARSPGRICSALFEKARQLGVAFVRAPVSGIRQDAAQAAGTWIIDTSAQAYRSQKVVIAAGVWSPGLLQPLGYKVPLVVERGYHVQFADPGVELRHAIMDVDNKVVASTMENGLRLAGTSEFAAIDSSANSRRYASLQRMAVAMLPRLQTRNRRDWMGRRPSVCDGLPVLGAIDGQRGLFGAFGHSHFGFMMAPKTGRILADLLSATPTNIDMSAFAIRRFGKYGQAQ